MGAFRRGCGGTVVSGGCGCGAFIVGAALAVALFAPQLLSGYGARVLARYLNSQIEGTAQVSDVALSWGSQQSADVRVLSPEGETVIEGSIDFPSLLDIFGDAETEQVYRLKINRLDSTIFKDGTSTLGKTFGVDTALGTTVLRRLAERAVSEVQGIRSRQPEASTRVVVRLKRGSILDNKSGRGNLEIRDSELVLQASSVDARVSLRQCTVVPEGQPGVNVSFMARFGRRPGSQEELLAAKFEAGALSCATLKTLGVLPRTAQPPLVLDRRIERDLFDRVTPGLFELAEEYIEEGAAVKFSFGGLQQMDERLPSRAFPLELRLDNDAGFVDIRAQVLLPDASDLAGGFDTAAIVGIEEVKGPAVPPLVSPIEGPKEDRDGEEGSGFRRGSSAVEFKVSTQTARLMDVISVLTPRGATAVPGEPSLPGSIGENATWQGRIRSLRIPFDRSCLRIGEFSDGLFGSEHAQAVVAAALRRMEGQMDIASVESNPARVTLLPDVESAPPAENTLTLRHLLTSVTLRGRLAGEFKSQWATARGARGISYVKGTLPGDPVLGGGATQGYPDGKLELQVMGVPQALLGSYVALPATFASLLPERFVRIVVRELPLRCVLGEDARDPELELEVWTESSERLVGTYRAGEFECPSGRIDIPLGDEARERVLMRLMPWLEDLEPVREGGQLDLTLEHFVFRLDAGSNRESGRLTIDSPPLRVKLDQRLAKQLRLGDTGAEGWIQWKPARMEFELDGPTTRYEAMELPLGDGQVAAMTGFETAGIYNLSTSLERRFLPRLSEVEPGTTVRNMVAVVIDNSAGGRPRVSVSPSEFGAVLEAIEEILSDEKRKELRKMFGLTKTEDE